MQNPIGYTRGVSDGPDNNTRDDDVELEYSPLERVVRRGGVSVKICIYRMEGEPGWSLEVEDHTGGSTVWNETFETDQAALDDAMRVIEQDGIDSFAKAVSAPSVARDTWKALTGQPHLAELRRLLDGSSDLMSFDATTGMLVAVVTVPGTVMPGQWLDLIRGKHVFRGMDDVQRFTNGVMALYNEVLQSVAKLGAYCSPDPGDRDAVREFCRGYLRIALQDPTWETDARAYARLLPLMILAELTPLEKAVEVSADIARDPEAWLSAEAQNLHRTVDDLYHHWADAREAQAERLAKQTMPVRGPAKVGRNDPCPCGSGRKFKKCCAN